MNQKGFATLEVILMIVVIGILASMAVPRFGAMTRNANTAKVQSDLATIDNAIQVYTMENTDAPTMAKLKDSEKGYIDNLKVPTGDIYIDGESETLSDASYDVDTVNKKYRGVLKTGTKTVTVDRIVLPKDK